MVHHQCVLLCILQRAQLLYCQSRNHVMVLGDYRWGLTYPCCEQLEREQALRAVSLLQDFARCNQGLAIQECDPCGSATELASNMLGRLPGHSGCFQSAPLNHCYGEAKEVSPQHSLFPARGFRDGVSWVRAMGSGAGIIPSWRMAPPRTRGQRSGGGWVLWCSPGDASSDCTGVSLSLGCWEAAGLASDRFSECNLGKGVPSCLEVTKIKLRSDRENEWFY